MTETSPPYGDQPARFDRWIVLKKTAGIYPGEFHRSPLAIVWALIGHEAHARAKAYFPEIPDYQIEVRLAKPEERAPEIPHLTAGDQPAPSTRVTEAELLKMESAFMRDDGSVPEFNHSTTETLRAVNRAAAEIRRCRALLVEVDAVLPAESVTIPALDAEVQAILAERKATAKPEPA